MAKKTIKRGDARTTKKWTRNRSDELAVAKGCWFSEEAGQFVVDWIQRYCRLYEGEYAGQVMELRDWQYECTMRLFGWQRWSERWNRAIRRFREGSIFVGKKNKKSPQLAAWGLYLLCGDGEQGQKIFLAAKDGMQARDIAGKHVLEMLRQSPELSVECTINKSTMQVTHERTRSILRPLSSATSRTKESKEGINGSVLVDEVHVVDKDLMSRVSRAGISRAEPLHIEVSTAGNNPDSYGKERFDRALKVISGEIEDQELFAAVYAAPQDLSDADLAADPLKWGRMANPSFGHTVEEAEYLRDYERSKVSITSLAEFKMYRLNIWQHTSNPWLKIGDWQKCRREFTEADLEGRKCWAGLDLSRTQDMSALVLIFPMDEPETYRILPFFWLPEQVGREKNHLVQFLSWANAGLLTLTPGNVIDYGFIRAQFRKLAKRFRIQELAYDSKYAEETTQALEQGVMDDRGSVIEEGTGVPRFIFPQTITEFAGPTAEFERLVISERLHHNGHAVLSWQISHTQVRTDCNQNKRPVKPERSDLKKIDGVVAGIMALGRAILKVQRVSCYESGGLDIMDGEEWMEDEPVSVFGSSGDEGSEDA